MNTSHRSFFAHRAMASVLRRGAWFIPILCLALLHVTGCRNKVPAGSESTDSSDSISFGGISGRGDREAVKALCEELSGHWLMTPSGWVSEYPAKTYIATGQRAGPESYYRQIKELKFYIQPGEISESDKLNGVQFSGNCEFTNSPVRVYGDPNAFGPAKWSDWKPSSETVRIEKRNGKWSCASVLGYLTMGTKPAEGAISQLK